MKPQIDIWQDYVTFEGQRIKRPVGWSVSQWYDFWEDVKRLVRAYPRSMLSWSTAAREIAQRF